MTDDTATFLRAHPPFEAMSGADLAFAASRLHPVRFAAGDVVSEPATGPAERFYVLRKGRITGEAPDDGTEVQEWRLDEGACFPVGALVENRPVQRVQRAQTDVLCLTMDRIDFEALRARSAPFDAFCRNRLAALLVQSRRHVRAEAVTDLGQDTSLNVALSARRMRPPVTCTPDTPIREALDVMSSLRIGSMIVTDADARPVGIFTLKDLLNRVALPGTPLEAPLSSVMTPDPVSLPQTAFAFEAAMAMAEAGIQHVCVVDAGRLIGVVSERDLFSMQRVGLVNLSKSIAAAGTVPDLARMTADIHQLVAQMMAQGVKVGQITQIITLLNDQIVQRVLALVLAEHGPPGVPFTWLAFGSEGRQEQTLKTDQDNGILFAVPDGMTADAVRARLLPLAHKVNEALDACGFTLCTGGIMARNPECCLSADEWRARFRRWINATTPENLLNAAIFFDFRGIHGPEEPVRALRHWLLDQIGENGLFRRQMAANALRNAPPLGMIREFRLSGTGHEANTVDLKFNGVTPFVDAARILALAARAGATNTTERLEAAASAGKVQPQDVAAWTDAYDYIRMLRLRLNERQSIANEPLGNRVDPAQLNELDRRILREAFKEARRLQAKLALDYQL